MDICARCGGSHPTWCHSLLNPPPQRSINIKHFSPPIKKSDNFFEHIKPKEVDDTNKTLDDCEVKPGCLTVMVSAAFLSAIITLGGGNSPNTTPEVNSEENITKRLFENAHEENYLDIGISLSLNGRRVEKVFNNTPAYRAGLQANSYITHINGLEIENMPKEKIVDLLKGQVGTYVHITLYFKGFFSPVTLVIQRQKMTSEQVKADNKKEYFEESAANYISLKNADVKIERDKMLSRIAKEMKEEEEKRARSTEKSATEKPVIDKPAEEFLQPYMIPSPKIAFRVTSNLSVYIDNTKNSSVLAILEKGSCVFSEGEQLSSYTKIKAEFRDMTYISGYVYKEYMEKLFQIPKTCHASYHLKQ